MYSETGIRDPPISHRALRIALGGGFKRTDRFVVIEAEQEGQPLIEILLAEG